MSETGILVIGVGNRWRSDDAAGLEVARRLREAPPAGARVIEREGEPVDLIEEWSTAGEAIVIDAVSSGAEPGAGPKQSRWSAARRRSGCAGRPTLRKRGVARLRARQDKGYRLPALRHPLGRGSEAEKE